MERCLKAGCPQTCLRFNKGDGAGDLMQEIDFLTEDKMEYDEFLRAFFCN